MTRQDRVTSGSETDAEQPDTGEREEQRRDAPDWADEAAQARTADDPRAVAPHDRLGVPSTGDTR